MTENNNFQLNLSLDSFTGPLDVLENMIRDRKMNILDLDISALADQYVSFINQNIKNIKIELACDYLVMATYLLELKSKKLLPTIDTTRISSAFMEERQQLINQLIEYRKYKQTLPKFFDKQANRESFFGKTPINISEYLPKVPVIEKMPTHVNPEKLFNTFITVLNKYRFSQLANRGLKVKEISVDMVKNDVINFLEKHDSFTFEELINSFKNISLQYFVTYFLAILELAKYRKLTIFQNEKSISIKKHTGQNDLDSDETQG